MCERPATCLTATPTDQEDLLRSTNTSCQGSTIPSTLPILNGSPLLRPNQCPEYRLNDLPGAVCVNRVGLDEAIVLLPCGITI